MEPKLRILIVDDDQRMTRTVADILSISGYEAVEASSGAEALEKVRAQAFDCVLTDVKMPEMNGVELHRQLRLAQPGLPVLLMTAYAADELIRQGLDEGVVGVFDKPLAINQLLTFFTSLAKHRMIVIVDDDPAFCQTLEDILSQRGFKVALFTEFTDPHIDVELIAAEAQVILLDLDLNHINGLDVLKEIRKSYPTLPVLLVTGYRKEMAEVIQGALEINAYACLYKPLEIPQLLQMLSEVQLKHLRGLLKSK
jgi:two-component system response regulator HydG